MTHYRFHHHHHHVDHLDKGLLIVRSERGHGLAVDVGSGDLSLTGHVEDVLPWELDEILIRNPNHMRYEVTLEATARRWWMVANFEDLFRRFADEQPALDPHRPELPR